MQFEFAIKLDNNQPNAFEIANVSTRENGDVIKLMGKFNQEQKVELRMYINKNCLDAIPEENNNFDQQNWIDSNNWIEVSTDDTYTIEPDTNYVLNFDNNHNGKPIISINTNNEFKYLLYKNNDFKAIPNQTIKLDVYNNLKTWDESSCTIKIPDFLSKNANISLEQSSNQDLENQFIDTTMEQEFTEDSTQKQESIEVTVKSVDNNNNNSSNSGILGVILALLVGIVGISYCFRLNNQLKRINIRLEKLKKNQKESDNSDFRVKTNKKIENLEEIVNKLNKTENKNLQDISKTDEIIDKSKELDNTSKESIDLALKVEELQKVIIRLKDAMLTINQRIGELEKNIVQPNSNDFSTNNTDINNNVIPTNSVTNNNDENIYSLLDLKQMISNQGNNRIQIMLYNRSDKQLTKDTSQNQSIPNSCYILINDVKLYPYYKNSPSELKLSGFEQYFDFDCDINNINGQTCKFKPCIIDREGYNVVYKGKVLL